MKLEYKKGSKLLAELEVFEKDSNTIYFGEIKSDTKESLIALLEVLKQNYHDKNIVGPINGSTWFSYRAVYESDGSDSFLMEPQNPTFFNQAFLECGFVKRELYNSSKTEIKTKHDSRVTSVLKRLHQSTIEIRNIELENYEQELKSLYRLTEESFKNNPFYESISKERFIALYSTFKPLIEPELCKIVKYHDEVVGYMFAYIDKTRLIIKTTAFKKMKVTAGITLVLMDEMSKYAHSKGCQEIVYALMNNNNHSSKTAQKNAKVFRRYAVYEYTHLKIKENKLS